MTSVKLTCGTPRKVAFSALSGMQQHGPSLIPGSHESEMRLKPETRPGVLEDDITTCLGRGKRSLGDAEDELVSSVNAVDLSEAKPPAVERLNRQRQVGAQKMGGECRLKIGKP